MSVAAAGSGCDKTRVGEPGSPRSPGPARRRGSAGGCAGSWRSVPQGQVAVPGRVAGQPLGSALWGSVGPATSQG